MRHVTPQAHRRPPGGQPGVVERTYDTGRALVRRHLHTQNLEVWYVLSPRCKAGQFGFDGMRNFGEQRSERDELRDVKLICQCGEDTAVGSPPELGFNAQKQDQIPLGGR